MRDTLLPSVVPQATKLGSVGSFVNLLVSILVAWNCCEWVWYDLLFCRS
jgi:hypothetical protein